MNKLLKPIIIILIVTAIFFAIQAFTSSLDKDYFQNHQEELTTNETIIMSDGEVTNFYYADTPYTKLAGISLLLYLIIPVLIVAILSRKRTLREAGILGLSFIIITLLLQAKNIYAAGSIEKALLYVWLIVGYGAIAMGIALITNKLSNYKRQKNKS
ncbi:MAG TPA: hypothetical protein VJA23_03440 [Candidatus Nanoarchaeia archaeon]|nr:hypothetical protein [Candidatus Nanoarchaeia archaeon]